jgi:hypothetical protein
VLQRFIGHRRHRAECRRHKVAISCHVHTFLKDTVPQKITGPFIQLCRSHLRNSHDSHAVMKLIKSSNVRWSLATYENPSIVPRTANGAVQGNGAHSPSWNVQIKLNLVCRVAMLLNSPSLYLPQIPVSYKQAPRT